MRDRRLVSTDRKQQDPQEEDKLNTYESLHVEKTVGRLGKCNQEPLLRLTFEELGTTTWSVLSDSEGRE